jgi:NTP pyrophosphatase (non-canonical NTP hydrolase)
MKKAMNLNELAKEIHYQAVSKGWCDVSNDIRAASVRFPEKIALMHSELSEALEEYRNGHPLGEVYLKDGKPEGVPIELADVIIRILDICGAAGIDIEHAITTKHAFNTTRPFRHGGKKA